MSREFAPWDDPAIKTRLKALLPVTLDIAAPPCPDCAHWRPVATTHEDGCWNGGVRLCHAEEQFRDFSCYRSRS